MEMCKWVMFEDGDLLPESEVDLDLYQGVDYSIYSVPAALGDATAVAKYLFYEGDDI